MGEGIKTVPVERETQAIELLQHGKLIPLTPTESSTGSCAHKTHFLLALIMQIHSVALALI